MPEELKPNAAPSPKSSLTPFQTAIIIILVVVVLIASAFVAFYFIRNSKDGGNAKSTGETESLSQPANEVTAGDVVPSEEPALTPETPAPAATSETKYADLYVKSYSFSENPEVDHEFTVKVVIGNKGWVEARNFFWEWWPTSSGRECKEEVDFIAAGGARAVECDYTYSGHANYSTKVVVDSEYDIVESNENNNVSTRVVHPIHEEEKPDLYVSALSFNHNPVMGEEFRVKITIKNKGGATAEHSDWEWWAASAVKACDGEIGGLDAGESETVNCDYTYGGWANYTTKAIVDLDNDIDESDEGNNTYTKTVMPIH